MEEQEILDSRISREPRRRELLPLWIKIFLWIFMVFGVIAPVGLIIGLLGMNINLSLYGLATANALSTNGLIIISLFALKGAVSFGLWTEKDWAINLAMLDAFIGILVCVLVMLVLPAAPQENGFGFNIRLELLILIPYLPKMQKIKGVWESLK